MKFPFIVKTLRYSVAIFIGMPLNIYVLTRMFKLARKCSDVYRKGSAQEIPVLKRAKSMEATTFKVAVQSYETLDWLGTSVLNGLCKIVVYSQHVSTSLSIWSWLIMSVLRYLSVYHPLVYIRLWQMPTKVLAGAFVVASTANSWLLISVKNNDEGSMTGDAGCTQTPLFESDIVNRVFLLVDCVCSIIQVLLHPLRGHSLRRSSRFLLFNSLSKREKAQSAILGRPIRASSLAPSPLVANRPHRRLPQRTRIHVEIPYDRRTKLYRALPVYSSMILLYFTSGTQPNLILIGGKRALAKRLNRTFC
ncbi:hypothetical protein PRIPAC_89668 [Pristionchus pacificus]|nr:hypothetical protein PRIPAC_89668 [Pristionchus pacificus]|eukprot:PDM82048.1 G protein-coupled receptor [Pristionchus pacificus]